MLLNSSPKDIGGEHGHNNGLNLEAMASDGPEFLRFSKTQLKSVYDIWDVITRFTVLGCAAAYFVAGVMACRVINTKPKALKFLCIPPISALIGGAAGFFLGAPTAFLVASIYSSIPTSVGKDYASALGVAQAALIIYFHLGRGESLAHTFR